MGINNVVETGDIRGIGDVDETSNPDNTNLTNNIRRSGGRNTINTALRGDEELRKRQKRM